MVEEAVEQMENIVSDEKTNRKRPLDDNAQDLSDTNVVSVVDNEVLNAAVEVDTTLQPSLMGVLQTEMETTKSNGSVSLVQEDRFDIDNRLQKRPKIESSSPAHKLPEEGGIDSHEQIIITPNEIILDDQNKVGNSDKLDVIQNKVIDPDSGTNIAEASSVSANNGEGELDVISHPEVCRSPLVQLKKKLLVLDINGLLVDIVSPSPYGHSADTYITRRAIFKRPHCLEFLKFCFERFDVGIWSSRTKLNVERVIDYLFEDMKHKLLFCWDSSHCTPSEFYTLENGQKTLVFKELKKLWDKHDPDLPWEKGHYNETNTLLLDDSPYKALLNPPYNAIFPYTYTYRNKKFDKSLGTGGALRVYLEGLAEVDNVPDYVEQHPFGQKDINENNPSWDFYVKAVGSAPPLCAPK